MSVSTTVGGRLRLARKRAGMSLAEVAEEAAMSISTLSRIETGKQPVEVQTFVSLSKILHIDPAALIGTITNGDDPVDPLLRQLRVIDRRERLRLWQQLAQTSRASGSNGRVRTTELAMEVEELLAQLDLVRAELEAVKGRLGSGSSTPARHHASGNEQRSGAIQQRD